LGLNSAIILINDTGSVVKEVIEVEGSFIAADTTVNCDLELSDLRASHEKELNEIKKSLEDAEAEHQRIVAELNTRLNELEAAHRRTVEEMSGSHLAEVEKLQAIISQRGSEDEDKSVSYLTSFEFFVYY
jgi:Skp family chaperone for outer membrane proteins